MHESQTVQYNSPVSSVPTPSALLSSAPFEINIAAWSRARAKTILSLIYQPQITVAGRCFGCLSLPSGWSSPSPRAGTISRINAVSGGDTMRGERHATSAGDRSLRATRFGRLTVQTNHFLFRIVSTSFGTRNALRSEWGPLLQGVEIYSRGVLSATRGFRFFASPERTVPVSFSVGDI